ncbi:MAG: hypothetical protein ABGX10_13355 [Paracoccus sp. (in: a-proteobacteria)]|uniref:hypothetical protein n=1 Tax=Paracoccus sp. TaxID=267 RepID=UPI0032428F4E
MDRQAPSGLYRQGALTGDRVSRFATSASLPLSHSGRKMRHPPPASPVFAMHLKRFPKGVSMPEGLPHPTRDRQAKDRTKRILWEMGCFLMVQGALHRDDPSTARALSPRGMPKS